MRGTTTIDSRVYERSVNVWIGAKKEKKRANRSKIHMNYSFKKYEREKEELVIED
jgi:hypothetical protein